MKFARPSQSFTNEERLLLANLVKEHKEEYDASVEQNKNITKWCAKRKKHVDVKPKGGYVAKAVRELYSDLKDVRNDDPIFSRAIKVASRAFQDIDALNDSSLHAPKKKRGTGGGRKAKSPEVRDALFCWFVDVRESLKGRLPKKLFKLKAQSLYAEWLEENPVDPEDQLKFTNPWMMQWQKEYGVSLRKPNKRFTLKREELKTRIEDYLQNVWYVRRYFLERFGVDPPVINGDQMPLHRNESSDQKTLAFKNIDTYVKENHMLSRERITVYTQVSSSENLQLRPEFIFKGKGTRTKVEVPVNIKYQWSPSGSYRLEHMEQTIKNLPNRYNPFTHKGFAIYVLDDYSVHLMPEVRKALWDRGYLLIVIGGGITGYIQLNDTHVHHHLKTHYREEENNLMLQMLTQNPRKVPSPSRENMINMLNAAWDSLDIDYSAAFKSLFITNKLDGSEDYLVSDRIISLVGQSMREYRDKLLQSEVPSSVKTVIKNLIPPKGVKRNFEGQELLLSYEMEDAEASDREDEDDTEDDNDEVQRNDVRNDLNESGQGTSSTAVVPTLVTNATGTRILLAGLSKNDEIEKDAVFLDKLGGLIEECQTSTLFTSHLQRIKRANSIARRSVRKRIKNAVESVESGPVERGDGESESEAESEILGSDAESESVESEIVESESVESENFEMEDVDVEDANWDSTNDVSLLFTQTRSGRVTANWRASEYR